MVSRLRVAAMLLVSVLLAGVLGLTPALGSPSRVAAYRTEVNRICRGYTPRLKQVAADSAAAQKAGNLHRAAYDLGLSLALALREDIAIEAVPVPAELRALMAPRLRLLKTIDRHARNVLVYSQAGDGRRTADELQTIASLVKPMNAMLDSAGLRDCGSNQA